MKAVFLLQWRRFYRRPVLVLAMFALTVIFVSVTAAGDQNGPQTIPLFAGASVSKQEAQEWLERLNEEERFDFELISGQQARERVAEGNISQAVQLLEADYRLLVGREDPDRFALDSFLRRAYTEELRLQAAEGEFPDLREDVEESLRQPALALSVSSLNGEGQFQYDGELQLLFGMTLFFVIYTIMFSLVRIIDEKRTGTWNRMIISPLTKWQMYLGHLAYSFSIGFSQITLLFLLFRFAFRFELGDQLWLLLLIAACYTFSIVALGLLLMALFNKQQQLSAVIPIVATGMAMVGGAFWPIELVTNDILLAISRVLPMTHGLEALEMAAVSGSSVQEMAQPLLFLLLFGGVCMALGIRLMEWRTPS